MLTFYLGVFVKIFFDLLSFLILVRVVLSWMQGHHTHNGLTRFVTEVTDPVMNVARKITPRLGMIDLSPVIALVALDLIRSLLLYLIGKQ